MSQERNKEPAVALEAGCVIDAAVCIEKEPEKTDASKLAPIFLRFLFRRASHACGAALRGLPLWWLVRKLRRFFCGKNERESSPLRRRDSEARSFRRSETATPAGATTQANGRPGRLCRPARAKRTEKEREDHGIELARIPEIHSLFRIARRNKPTKDWFSGGS